MYKALIIDDEPGARSALKELLVLFCPEVDQITEATGGAEALKIIQRQPLDLIFVDIQLKRINGIQLAEKLINYCNNLIFVTAHDQYALQAFQANALHYLLKPVDPRLLKNAVKRVHASKTSTVRRTEAGNRLTLYQQEGMVILEYDEILYVQGAGNYCTFYCRQGKQYLVSKNLAHYERLLNSKDFLRIHQSYLINIQYVRRVVHKTSCHVILRTDEKLPVARRRKEALLRALAV